MNREDTFSREIKGTKNYPNLNSEKKSKIEKQKSIFFAV